MTKKFYELHTIEQVELFLKHNIPKVYVMYMDSKKKLIKAGTSEHTAVGMVLGKLYSSAIEYRDYVDKRCKVLNHALIEFETNQAIGMMIHGGNIKPDSDEDEGKTILE